MKSLRNTNNTSPPSQLGEKKMAGRDVGHERRVSHSPPVQRRTAPAPVPENFESVRSGNASTRYIIMNGDEKIGEGSFSNVYSGWDTVDHMDVAVKVLLNQPRDAPSTDATLGLASLSREIDIDSCLRHENILNMLDHFVRNGQLCFVFEFVEHGDLFEWVTTKSDERTDDELEHLIKSNVHKTAVDHITAQLASAMAYAHAEGIAHRDIKPENILITQRSPLAIKIIDWGLAYRKSVDSEDERNKRVGSLYYAAPELIHTRYQADGGIDPFACDAWSFGIVVYAIAHLTVAIPASAFVKETFRGYSKVMNKISSDISPHIIRVIEMTRVVYPKGRFSIAHATTEIRCPSLATSPSTSYMSLASPYGPGAGAGADELPAGAASVPGTPPMTDRDEDELDRAVRTNRSNGKFD